MRRTRTLVAILALVAGVAACGSDQDPGFTPDTGGGPSTTSHTLGTCPPGGPDATTPPAGCLDAEGNVQH